jgi:hypothetical protein
MTTPIVKFTDITNGSRHAVYAFLAEKEQRSSSRRTMEDHSQMLWRTLANDIIWTIFSLTLKCCD